MSKTDGIAEGNCLFSTLHSYFLWLFWEETGIHTLQLVCSSIVYTLLVVNTAWSDQRKMQ